MFGFKPKKTEVEEKKEDAKDAYDRAVESANLCLHAPGFKQFVERYQIAERKTIDALLEYAKTEVDPLKFAFGAQDLLGKINNIRVLLDSVHANAGEKYAPNKNKQAKT